MLGIPVKSVLLVHGNIALAILTDNRNGLGLAEDRGTNFRLVDVAGAHGTLKRRHYDRRGDTTCGFRLNKSLF